MLVYLISSTTLPVSVQLGLRIMSAGHTVGPMNTSWINEMFLRTASIQWFWMLKKIQEKRDIWSLLPRSSSTKVSGSQVSKGEAMLKSQGVVLNLGCTGITWEVLKYMNTWVSLVALLTWWSEGGLGVQSFVHFPHMIQIYGWGNRRCNLPSKFHSLAKTRRPQESSPTEGGVPEGESALAP